jgi:stearoyl-CoA desaturase (delta-9 desaturase)
VQGFLWGGLTRMFATHVCIATVNSVGHRFGASPLTTGDGSRNLAWLALPSLGDGWHNNHHALPGVASLRFEWWQVDPGAALIWLLERCHLATDVRWPTRRMLDVKLRQASGGS